jgi:hypothetical protein
MPNISTSSFKTKVAGTKPSRCASAETTDTLWVLFASPQIINRLDTMVSFRSKGGPGSSPAHLQLGKLPFRTAWPASSGVNERCAVSFIPALRKRIMRFLLKVNIPVESGNAVAKAGKLAATMQSILSDLKPEAVYFSDDKGQRTAYLFLDLQDASQIPAIAEPWFLAFNANIELHPVMVLEDLAKAGSAIEKAVKKYA